MALPTGQDKNAVLQHYARELQKIYDGRTAGDYTFEGVLAEFCLALDQKETLPEITASMRFAVANMKYALRERGRYYEAHILDQVQFAESFPHNYRDEAVDLSRRLIVRLAGPSNEDEREIKAAISKLIDERRWMK